jgi:hypothetical protein
MEQYAPRLSEIDARFCDLDDVGIHQIATQADFSKLRAFTRLYLSCNKFGDMGATALAKAISVLPGPGLVVLDLSYNAIGSQGIAAIVQAVQANLNLSHLCLYQPNVGETTVMATAMLCAQLHKLSRLSYLELPGIDKSNASSVARALVHLPLLRPDTLHVSIGVLDKYIRLGRMVKVANSSVWKVTVLHVLAGLVVDPRWDIKLREAVERIQVKLPDSAPIQLTSEGKGYVLAPPDSHTEAQSVYFSCVVAWMHEFAWQRRSAVCAFRALMRHNPLPRPGAPRTCPRSCQS